VNRMEFPAMERGRRSRIAQLSHYSRLLRGTLSLRSRRCGKAGCRCARGELHVSLYLVQSQKGRPRQIYVPKEWEDRVRRAVTDYQELQKLVEDVSDLEWKRLEERKE
jgi:hypothetical protein